MTTNDKVLDPPDMQVGDQVTTDVGQWTLGGRGPGGLARTSLSFERHPAVR
ncbi:hypothetical protein ABGB16_15700 [Micromonospora sp. B11E3]|uniref:hypothetical protein n=1 Tax=Micromonospora sp. B11E3 TaxID=3153562 RepID=UPI00325DE34A